MTNTTSTKTARFTIDFINKQIIGTKASFNKASKGSGAEYEELTAKIAARPNFELVINEPKSKSTKVKRTYDGLDYKFMEAYIATKADSDRFMKEYEAVKKMAASCGTKQEAMFAQAQSGDTITVLEVSRLCRSTKQLCEIIERIREKCLRLVIVGSITLDCRNGQADPMSEAFLQMAGVFSQLELSMIRSRVRSGMQNARAKGAKIGRPQLTVDDLPSGFLRHYPAYKKGQLNISELARVCELSRTTIYKYIELLEG